MAEASLSEGSEKSTGMTTEVRIGGRFLEGEVMGFSDWVWMGSCCGDGIGFVGEEVFLVAGVAGVAGGVFFEGFAERFVA